MKWLMLVLLGCSSPAPQPNHATGSNLQSSRTDAAIADSDEPTVNVRNDHEWTIRVVHKLGTQSATGEIVVSVKPTDAVPAPHAELASAVAWRLIASSLISSDPSAAITAAKHGIDDLGHRYWYSPVKDDTSFAVSFAEEDIAAGNLSDGATKLNSVLDTRIALYFEKYKTAVAKP